VPNLEARQPSSRRLPAHLDGVHARVRLGRLVPLDARFDEGPVALEDCLDPAVRQVLDVSVQAERFRPLRAVRAEVHALHAAVENDPSPPLHEVANRDGWKELY